MIHLLVKKAYSHSEITKAIRAIAWLTTYYKNKWGEDYEFPTEEIMF
jgi:hypothetical protein